MRLNQKKTAKLKNLYGQLKKLVDGLYWWSLRITTIGTTCYGLYKLYEFITSLL